MGRAYVVVAIGIAPCLERGEERQEDLEQDHADDERAAAGDVGGDGARVDAENGDLGESGVGGEAALEFPAKLSVS